MKKKTLILFLTIIALMVGILLVESFRNSTEPQVSTVVYSNENQAEKPVIAIKEKSQRKDPVMDLHQTAEEFETMMKSSVEFYGKVLDQDNQPVVDAIIRCSWPLMTSTDGLQVRSTAPDGRFEVKGRNAMEMTFSLDPPDGYRQTETSTQKFQFADYSERLKQKFKTAGKSIQIKYLPDPANPVIFRIKKIGAADVLHKAYQGSDILPRDGSPRYYSLSAPSRKGLAQPRIHSIEVRLISTKEPDDNSMSPASWSMSIGVSDGGIQLLDITKNPITDTYNEVHAPEGGYHNKLFFEFPDTMPGWKPQFNEEFFIRFSDRTYGRATISGDWKRVRIQSLYNPNGSKNLLLDETMVVEIRNME